MKKIKMGVILFLMTTVPLFLSSCHGQHDHEEADHEDGHNHAHGEKEHEGHEEDEHGHHEPEGIVLSPEAQKSAGIQTMKLQALPLSETINVTGRIAQDVEKVFYVTSPYPGTVTKCPKELGAFVAKGDVLCLIKVDESDEVIEIKAPEAGVMTTDFANVGERVDTISPIHTIADFSKLAANFDVYEKDIRHVKQGQKMTVKAIAYPEQEFQGEIIFISPRVDESTYTVKIRALIDNSDNLLKPGMSVGAEIISGEEKAYLTVPPQAIQTIEGKKMVFVQTDEQTFTPKEVLIKSENAQQVAIGQGLNGGDTVVVEGSFILKSKMLESEMEHGHSH